MGDPFEMSWPVQPAQPRRSNAKTAWNMAVKACAAEVLKFAEEREQLYHRAALEAAVEKIRGLAK